MLALKVRRNYCMNIEILGLYSPDRICLSVSPLAEQKEIDVRGDIRTTVEYLIKLLETKVQYMRP